jgi:hypothetical protein
MVNTGDALKELCGVVMALIEDGILGIQDCRYDRRDILGDPTMSV